MTSKTENPEIPQESNMFVAFFRRVFTGSSISTNKEDDVFLTPQGITFPEIQQRMYRNEDDLEEDTSLDLKICDRRVPCTDSGIADMIPERCPGLDDMIRPCPKIIQDDVASDEKLAKPAIKAEEEAKDADLLTPEIMLPILKPTMNF